MKFGYFDDKAREYVIERPDTPRSWANYLGSTEYGAIITNNGGGYSFHMSAAQGRLMRLRFDDVPDRPAGPVYLPPRQGIRRLLVQRLAARRQTARPVQNHLPARHRLHHHQFPVFQDRNGNHLFRSAGQTFRMLAAESHESRRRQKKPEPVHLCRIPELRACLQRFPQPAILARHREDGFRGRHH